jgi:predicted TPR repeat methyltransferase
LPDEGYARGDAERLIADGRAFEAVKLLRALVQEGGAGLQVRLLLVRALLAAGKNAPAFDAGREVAQLYPDLPEAAIAFGDALQTSAHLAAAIAEYQRALRLQPQNGEARLKLGLAWLEAGETDVALEQFAKLDPASVPELAAHIARAEAMRRLTRSDAGYVRHLFNQFSANYDDWMRRQLQYRAPEILRELADLVMPGAHDLVILDLGCGTGLGGAAFADLAASLDGIDLSPAMIAHARERHIYRRLTVTDFETVLADGGPDYDLVLAADTFVYFGDLAPTFAAVARRLKPGGYFLFTAENSAGPDFALGAKRRWSHSETYLRNLGATAGLQLAGIVACAPRSEANVPVDGLAVAFSKPI